MEFHLDFPYLEHLWKDSARPLVQGTAPLYWKDFLALNRGLCLYLQSRPEKDWYLFTEESDTFLLGFLALWLSSKNIHIMGKAPGDRKFPLLTDTAGTPENIPVLAERWSKLEGNPGYTRNEEDRVIFYTSGSTGIPKLIEKNPSQLEIEVRTLIERFSDELSGDVTVYSTVPLLHFYGNIFAFLLPLLSGVPLYSRRVQFQESLSTLEEGKKLLITSPAFLKRLDAEYPAPGNGEFILFSAGGFLPGETAQKAYRIFHTEIREIYGSTETGSIGWRLQPTEKEWHLFPPHTLEIDEDGAFLQSPYLPHSSRDRLDDRLEWTGDRMFRLLGRNDSVVKVEEKRVALNDMEQRLIEHPWVSDCLILFFQGKRQYLGAVVSLEKGRREEWGSLSKRELNKTLRLHLGPHFSATVLPKKWRYPDEIPRNSMGKVEKEAALSLFENTAEELCGQPVVLHKEREDYNWKYTLVFPENYRYFDGHFPELKILPALAQIHWILLELGRELDRKITLAGIPRIKFKNPVFPEKQVDVTFGYNEEKQLVSYTIREGKEVCSSGKIRLGGGE